MEYNPPLFLHYIHATKKKDGMTLQMDSFHVLYPIFFKLNK